MIAARSFFDDRGLDDGVKMVVDEMSGIYRADDVPWVVGYSGGKDSTAVLSLTWRMLRGLGGQAHKPVHVISTDTLVENPVVSAWVGNSLSRINTAAQEQGVPVSAHMLTPEIRESFWVNLIGRGYPAPRPMFRWCTSRMKINPANRFINSVVDKYGSALMVLGIRKAESAARSAVIEKRKSEYDTHERISPNHGMPNSYVYSPIEDWRNDDVWMLLLETENPWGLDNTELFSMYRGATEDGECPMVVSSGTPSCGDSRFGCWVCTLVEKDKSMQAMIRNDDEKQWMKPLMEVRNLIDFRAMGENGDRPLRDFRRMNGNVQPFHGSYVPGPYKQEFRAELLRRVLQAQSQVRAIGPTHVRNINLIQMEELKEIRRIWLVEKHEMEDILPTIYEEATGEEYEIAAAEEKGAFGPEELALLKNLCGDNPQQYELARELLSVGMRHRNSYRRKGVFDAIEKAIERNFYDNPEDAIRRATARAEAKAV